jgi:hypothetical protein
MDEKHSLEMKPLGGHHAPSKCLEMPNVTTRLLTCRMRLLDPTHQMRNRCSACKNSSTQIQVRIPFQASPSSHLEDTTEHLCAFRHSQRPYFLALSFTVGSQRLAKLALCSKRCYWFESASHEWCCMLYDPLTNPRQNRFRGSGHVASGATKGAP